MPNKVVAVVGVERLAVISKNDVSHVAVGTGVTMPQASDTILVTETARIAPTSAFTQSTKFQIRAFFTNAQLPATTEEVGVFLNGTGAPNSGSLLARALLTFVKGSADLALIFEFELEEQN